MIDDEDLELVSKKNWRLQKNGYVSESKSDGVYLHRYVMNAQKGEYVDHINHNPLDNRKSNLRICTNAENSWNKNHKRLVGVAKTTRMRSKTWRAYITVNKKWIHLGYFKTKEEGAIAYNIAVKEYRDSYSSVNTF
ncbi:HNH endonuclease [Candidatus Gracilibacteria bacterium]|nr:HNH endonuclease [Candidatus Gracilibacteria bacterium]